MSNDQYSREYTQLDVSHNFMYSPPNKENGKRGTFRMSMVKNKPRFTVRTNIPSDQDNEYGRIVFPCDIPTALVFFQNLIDLSEGKHAPGTKLSVTNCTIWGKQGRRDEPLELTELIAGRHEDGRVYAAIFAKTGTRPRQPYYFGPNPHAQAHALKYNGDYDQVKESELYAGAFAFMFRDIMMRKANDNFTPTSKDVAMPPNSEDDQLRQRLLDQEKSERGRQNSNGRGGFGGNKGGNNYRNNNGGGNYQQKPQQQAPQTNNGAPSDTNGSDWDTDDFPSF